MKRAILLLSSIGLMIFVALHPTRVSAASLFFSPSAKSTTVGSTVTLNLKVNSSGQAINAAEGTVVFSTNRLQLTSISKANSIFSFWAVQPNGSNSTGRVTFSGGLASPGYNGSSGTTIAITFRATAAGQGDISISGAKVLANDGQGTDVLTSVGTASITISAASVSTPPPATPTSPAVPTPSSTAASNQNSWYHDSQVTISWNQPNGATGYSFHLSQDANDVPDHQVDQTSTSTIVTLSSDGVWYLALQANSAAGWSETAHFRLQYDHTAPLAFTPVILRDRGATDPTPQVQFSTTDAGSGIDHYTVMVDAGQAATATSPLTLSSLSSGDHTVVVTAYDKAGNTTTSQVTVSQIGYPAPKLETVTSPLVLLDHLEVSGTASAGDRITVYVNGQSIGAVIAGQADQAVTASGVTIQAPWDLKSNHVFRPGHYQVTAVATGPDGQVSSASDAMPLLVSGHSILLGGQVIATFSAAPVAVITLILLAGLITFVMARLLLAVKRMHDHDTVVEEEVETLRRQVRRKLLTDPQVDEALETIERDLERSARPRPRTRRPARRR